MSVSHTEAAKAIRVSHTGFGECAHFCCWFLKSCCGCCGKKGTGYEADQVGKCHSTKSERDVAEDGYIAVGASNMRKDNTRRDRTWKEVVALVWG